MAGLVVLLTGWQTADTIVALLIAVLILWSSWGILDEAGAVKAVPGVLGLHDQHVWTVASGMVPPGRSAGTAD